MPKIDPDTNLDKVEHQLTFHQILERGVTTADELTGSLPIVDKELLVGVPFIISEFTCYSSDKFQGEYVNIKIVLATDERVCFNDGGSGILPALLAFCPRDEALSSPIYCPRGLRVSRDYTNKQGIKGTTFYLA